LTNDDACGKITIEGERVLLYYRDSFGKTRSKHLMCCTGVGIVEWRTNNVEIACSLGTVEVGSDGHRYIKIPLSSS